MSKVKLTDYVVEFLQKKGIHDFFGYQGTMIAHLVDSIEHNSNTKSHSSYNEQGAAFAACGYAQAKDSYDSNSAINQARTEHSRTGKSGGTFHFIHLIPERPLQKRN